MLNDDYAHIYIRNTSSPVPSEPFSNYCIEQKETNTSNVISIFLYQPHMRIQRLRVKSDRMISMLSRNYIRDMAFIFNGQILNKEKSFSFYGIPDGSKIAMIPEDAMKADPTFQEKWINITCDKENFDKKIEMSINPNCRREMSRLNDIRYQKLEMKRRTHSFFVRSKLVTQNFDGNSSFTSSSVNNESNDLGVSNQNQSFNNNYYDLYKKGSKKNDIQLTVDYEMDENPSAEPLPIIW